VIDARKPNAVDRIAEAAPNGLDAVLALAGSKVLNASVKLVRRGGRVAYPNGVEPAPRKRAGVRTIAYDAEVNATELVKLGRVAEEIGLVVPIEKSYPLEQASKAHAREERGHVVGRIALTMR
jgi:D-arabinose 1-dehydrogenase-like Zn-dependent alcohol dehydrogenase